jgi:uncharacterized protein (TIGR03083 family)
MERDEHLAHLRSDIDGFAAAVEHGPLEAPVPWCGAWTLGDLGEHLGGVHRWARSCILTARPGAPDPDPAPADGAGMAEWLRAGGAALVDALTTIDLDGPTWHPFPVPRVGAVWPRRQAQETSVHRWDAQRAIGQAPSIDPRLAADGIDEYFALALPRLMIRESVGAPAQTVLVRATDTGDEWHVGAGDGGIVAVTDATAPSTVLTGAAADVLLALWRRPLPGGAVTVQGDRSWLDLGGM